MGRRQALTAWVMQKAGPFTVRYGEGLDFASADLPAPVRIRIPTREGLVRCRVQHPRPGPTPSPVVVHFHGGAFIVRYPQMDDFYTRFLAEQVSAMVVSVDYDVAPQKAYPVAQHQAHDVVAWFVEHGAGMGVDGRRIALSGFSAGGNLAASAALQARDVGSFAPALVVLGVPSLDVAEPATAKSSTVARPLIDARLLELVRETYYRDASRRPEPYASPLLEPDLTDYPPTLVLTAEVDTLRREGDAFAARLLEAGVDVTHHVVPERDHHFMLASDAVQARETLDLIVAHLRVALGQPAG